MYKTSLMKWLSISVIIFGSVLMVYTPQKTEPARYNGNPTVFVHGFKGTENSFGNLLERFEYRYNWGQRDIVYHVTRDGEIVDKSFYPEHRSPAFVQLVFEHNRASIPQTTEWLGSVLLHLKEYYSVETVNLVGHSMGGIVSAKYTLEMAGEGYPDVSKLMTIGSPFDGIYSEEYFAWNQAPATEDLRSGSKALTEIQQGSFPKGVQVFNVGSTGDMVARPESVLALRETVPTSQYGEYMIEDPKLGHSALHEDPRVDQLIYDFLWHDTNKSLKIYGTEMNN